MNKVKLLKLRDDLNRYLEKHDTTEKVMVLDKEINSFTSQTVSSAVKELGSKIDFGLSKDTSSVELIEAIQDLGDRLIKATPSLSPTDRTDEVIKAISGIRFPEVNFPNTISVDNFPPQKIPQPVTNIKSTLVADDTGLLQEIVDGLNDININAGEVIHQFVDEVSISAGDTVDILTYTVPTGKIFTLMGVYAEGIDDGVFSLFVSEVKIWQGRNAWTDRNVQSYLQIDVPAGEDVWLRVHNPKNLSKIYTGGFYGRQIDA